MRDKEGGGEREAEREGAREREGGEKASASSAHTGRKSSLLQILLFYE